MANATWLQLLNAPQAGNNWTGVAGTALASSTTETIISPSSPDFTFNLHAPSLYPGQVIRVVAYGIYSTTVTPTLQLRLRYGGVAGVVLIDSTAITATNNASNTAWMIEALISCRSVGTSGTVWPQGFAFGLPTPSTMSLLPASAPAVATIDTTVSKALVLTGQWGANSASNTVTCEQFTVEGLC